ncbi:MarR family winged helix-turn-helix transcriptional regulator [Calycomorphotria hydatis]|uniref:Transcriptional regulator SlyA n=1 Tax=Calycomorphotria hydatis TaxID=2528027 RepID=A0A517T5Y8_9PLAN|nr:MarR family winged helix-turn-helix transcriptional regulator [Calycomorphotria hydatis]QDT63771.1 Transcriptional regulator SlyA [Calycomorphotria hydatis]
MSEEKSEHGICYWLAVTSHALRKVFDAELSGEGITLRQFEVLAWLTNEGEMSQNALAEMMNLEPGTLAGILCRMERDGWLERRCCSDDRRRKLLQPTEFARTEWDRLSSICDRVRGIATAGISEEELEVFRDVCDRVRNNLQEAGNEESSPIEIATPRKAVVA